MKDSEQYMPFRKCGTSCKFRTNWETLILHCFNLQCFLPQFLILNTKILVSNSEKFANLLC